MIEFLNHIILKVSDVLYQPWCVPLLLVLGGICFTVHSKFVQVRFFKEAFHVVLDKPSTEDGISSFGALMISTASRVGTGNIIGVSTAICLGGAGSVFWMWITAFFGSATAFTESTLAQIFKKKNADGTSYGGPAFYMQDALKLRWLGVVFSFIIIAIYAVGYNLLASYNLQSTFSAFRFYDAKKTPMLIGIVLAVLFGIIIIGGAKRLSHVTEILVPVMGVIYVIVSLLVLVLNIRNVPEMFRMIFENAFDFKAIVGGFSGSCIMYGVKRGLYSNEAGMGSAPNAAATADVSHPAKQGLVQMLSVYIDTILICTATAFMCLCTDVVPTKELAGAAYVQQAMKSTLGNFGPIFIAVAMSLFAFTTLIGNYSYCEGCLKFILKREASRRGLLVFRIFAAIIVFLGAVSGAALVWNLAEMLQGMAVVINIPVIFVLNGVAMKCLEDYSRQRKEGKEPVFHSADIGLEGKTEFWNER